MSHLPPWELPEGGEGHGDGGVDVAARDLRAEEEAEDSSNTPPAAVREDEPVISGLLISLCSHPQLIEKKSPFSPSERTL